MSKLGLEGTVTHADVWLYPEDPDSSWSNIFKFKIIPGNYVSYKVSGEQLFVLVTMIGRYNQLQNLIGLKDLSFNLKKCKYNF